MKFGLIMLTIFCAVGWTVLGMVAYDQENNRRALKECEWRTEATVKELCVAIGNVAANTRTVEEREKLLEEIKFNLKVLNSMCENDYELSLLFDYEGEYASPPSIGAGK
ncbi:hypothetical protein ES703_104709 [subsurface metagenome]